MAWIAFKRFCGEHAAAPASAVVLAYLLACCVVGRILDCAGVTLWPNQYPHIVLGMLAGAAIAMTVAVWILGCWRGRAGLRPRTVLRGLLWLPCVYFAALLIEAHLAGAEALLGAGWLTLAVIVFLVGPPSAHDVIQGVLILISSGAAVGYVSGWLLAELTTRRCMRTGRWESVGEPVASGAPLSRPAHGLIGATWGMWLYVLAASVSTYAAW